MTKHPSPTKALDDRPVRRNFTALGRGFNQFEGRGGVFVQPFDGLKDALSFEGLSFVETYMENRLWIVLKYSSAADELRCVVFVGHDETQTRNTGTVGEFDSLIKPHHPVGWNEDNVFIRDVELVEAVKIELPSIVWLNVVEDDFEDRIAGREIRLFMSIDGTFKRLPILSKRELSMIAPGCGVGIGGDMVSVIEGGMEIVNGIAQNGASMLGKGAYLLGDVPFQRACLILSPQSFYIATGEVPENGLKITDVMFGPFGF